MTEHITQTDRYNDCAELIRRGIPEAEARSIVGLAPNTKAPEPIELPLSDRQLLAERLRKQGMSKLQADSRALNANLADYADEIEREKSVRVKAIQDAADAEEAKKPENRLAVLAEYEAQKAAHATLVERSRLELERQGYGDLIGSLTDDECIFEANLNNEPRVGDDDNDIAANLAAANADEGSQ
jgi:hypothetical protein